MVQRIRNVNNNTQRFLNENTAAVLNRNTGGSPLAIGMGNGSPALVDVVAIAPSTPSEGLGRSAAPSTPSEGPGRLSDSSFSEDEVTDWHAAPQLTAAQLSHPVAAARSAATIPVVARARPHFACQGPRCRICNRTHNTTPYDEMNLMVTNISCPVCGGSDCGNTICPCYGQTITVRNVGGHRSRVFGPWRPQHDPHEGGN